MAFDGFTVAALKTELNEVLSGGRITRITQPEVDELLLTVRPEAAKKRGQVRLVLCADASLPLVYLTEENRTAPEQAPTFCMLLRKHLQNGKIMRVSQPGLERILRFTIEHYNEMGDLCQYTLVIEIMGKHSNIILLEPGQKENEVILDSIKHVSSMMSSVREVLPGRPYWVPETQNKTNPFEETKEHFFRLLSDEPAEASSFLLHHYTGFSVRMSEEAVFHSHLSQDRSTKEFNRAEQEAFWNTFSSLLRATKEEQFSPCVYYHLGAADTLSQGEPVDFSAFPLSMYKDLPCKTYESMSSLVETYYREKNAVTRIRQKSSDLRTVVQNLLERDLHKYDLQQKQLKETEKKDKYRLYGELLNTYGYEIQEGAKSADLNNYYTGKMITVPLDPTKTALQNAQHYFERYTKLKRTKETLSELTKEVKQEIDELETIKASLDLSMTETDLQQIREEMEEAGFLHRHASGKSEKSSSHTKGTRGKKNQSHRISTSQMLHYISSCGYDIYVGKNNLQNDELTFHIASPTDIWFHANDKPGSHVILRTNGTPFEEVPDVAFEEAARLAAYYSSARDAGRCEVDYVERRNLKKPSGSRPGFVVYYTNYSILVHPDIQGIAFSP